MLAFLYQKRIIRGNRGNWLVPLRHDTVVLDSKPVFQTFSYPQLAVPP